MCANKVTMLRKLAMEETLMDVDGSLPILIFWWVMQYNRLRVCRAMLMDGIFVADEGEGR